MVRRLTLIAIALSSLLIPALCLIGAGWAALGFAAVAMAFPVGLMALGAAGGDGRLGAVAWPLGALLVLLEAGLAGMIVFRGEVEGGPWLLGLPAAAAIQLYGLLLVPLAVVALGYALTFDGFGVAEEDLERLRRAAHREGGG